MSNEKSIICTILGSSNAGKSTLLNQIVGAKIAITTPKLQTTRRRIMGVKMVGDTQCVFVDTPGIFKPQKTIDQEMMKHAWASVKDIDLVIVLVDVIKLLKGKEEFLDFILRRVQERDSDYIIVLNKVDKLSDKTELLKLAEQVQKMCHPRESGDLGGRPKGDSRLRGNDKTTPEPVEIFFISATTGDGVDSMLKGIAKKADFPNYLFPPEQMTDMNPKDLAREITREKLMMNLDRELPYEIMVEAEQWDEGDKNIIIKQVIYVSRETLKKIVIGDNATRIKKVNEQARRDMERLLGKKIHLYLHVKVDKKCMEKREFLDNI